MPSEYENPTPVSQSKRRASLDLIRIFACLCVLICHSRTMLVPADSPLSPICYVLGYVGVPFFVALTGYLFLDRTFDGPYLNKYVKRNFLPLLVAFEIWNIVWYLCTKVPILLEGGWYARPFDTVVRQALFIGASDSALWYLHLCIALYLGIPIIARILSWLTTCGKNAYSVLLVACLVLFGTMLPTASEYAPLINENFEIDSVIGMNIFDASVWGNSVWMIYLVAGYAIKRGLFSKIPFVALVCMVIVLMMLCVGLAACDMLLGRYENILLVALCILAFELFDRSQRCFADHPAPQKALGSFSKYAFPTYMVHLWVGSVILYVLRVLGIGKEFMLALPIAANAPAYLCLIIVWFLASCLVTKLISFIPGAKKWMLLWK